MNQNQKFTEQISNPENSKKRVPFWYQLRWNLILFFVLLAVVPVIIAVIISIVQVNIQAREQVRRQLESIAELKRGQITRWLEDSQATLDLFLADPTRKNRIIALGVSSSPETVTQDSLNELMSSAVKAQPLFDELFLYNAKGEVLAASNPTEIGKVVTAQPFFVNSLAENYIQPPYYAVGSAELSMLITRPLINPRGQVIGVLAGRLDLSTLGQIMQDLTGLTETNSGETYLVSLENNYLVTPSRFENEGYSLTQAYHSLGIDQVLKGVNGSDIYENYQRPSVLVIGAYRWIPELQIGLVAEVAEAEALATFERARNSSMAVALMAAVVAAGVGLYSAGRISKPITNLTQVATRIAAGDLNQQVDSSQRNEIGLLAVAFNSMTLQLQQLISSLEERVAARTRRLEIAANLGEHLSAILKVEQLLTEVVNQVKDNFDYYHTHIYLFDDKQERLIVVEGTGIAGAEMKAKKHSIYLNAPTSLVARAARTGEIVRVDNVREVRDWLPNPLLPDTYSEMAVPVILEEKVVGVLDVQQDKVAGLDEGDASLLRTLANQIAIAIRNARQFTEVETALEEARALQRRYLVESWDKSQATRKNVGRVQFSLGESTTLDEAITANAQQQALSHKKPALVTLNGQPDGQGSYQALVAPIMLRDVAIGNMQLHEIDPDRIWSEGELALINAVVEQVAQAAETLRLLNETQERASREELVSQISNKIRRASDMESLLKVAVSELSRVLNPARTFVHVGPEAMLEIQPSVSNSKENGDA
jgi:GAF domain-containing protein